MMIVNIDEKTKAPYLIFGSPILSNSGYTGFNAIKLFDLDNIKVANKDIEMRMSDAHNSGQWEIYWTLRDFANKQIPNIVSLLNFIKNNAYTRSRADLVPYWKTYLNGVNQLLIFKLPEKTER